MHNVDQSDDIIVRTTVVVGKTWEYTTTLEVGESSMKLNHSYTEIMDFNFGSDSLFSSPITNDPTILNINQKTFKIWVKQYSDPTKNSTLIYQIDS